MTHEKSRSATTGSTSTSRRRRTTPAMPRRPRAKTRRTRCPRAATSTTACGKRRCRRLAHEAHAEEQSTPCLLTVGLTGRLTGRSDQEQHHRLQGQIFHAVDVAPPAFQAVDLGMLRVRRAGPVILEDRHVGHEKHTEHVHAPRQDLPPPEAAPGAAAEEAALVRAAVLHMWILGVLPRS